MAKFSLSTLLKCFLMYCIHVTVLIIKKEIFNRLFVNVSALLILIEWVLGVEFFVKIWRKKIAKNINCHLLSSLINFIKVWERLFFTPCPFVNYWNSNEILWSSFPHKQKTMLPIPISHFEISGSEFNWKIKQN